jgi:SAM-dependent methyltransferase
MHYSEAHEAIYARRLAAGREGWEDGEYDNASLRNLVQSWLEVSSAAKAGATALELGCGTGAISCLLAERGLQVTGLDLSVSAIGFARAMAVKRGLNITFEATQACDWQPPENRFDVILDSHCLHCIVRPAERRMLLAQLAKALRPQGELWTETMAVGINDPIAPTQRIEPDGTLWTKVADASGYDHAVQDPNGWWIPMRYIAPSAEALLAEFAAANLRPIDWSLVPPTKPGEAADFRARFRRMD